MDDRRDDSCFPIQPVARLAALLIAGNAQNKTQQMKNSSKTIGPEAYCSGKKQSTLNVLYYPIPHSGYQAQWTKLMMKISHSKAGYQIND